jgi:peptidoglycan/xylan/chitin deacetylase (PgdA/CDA1 family)
MVSMPAAASDWSVALTFDDLPKMGGGDCAQTEVLSVNQSILDTLDQFGAPAAAFVIPGTPCQGDGAASAASIARLWSSRGHAIGNHTDTHPDYNTLSIDAFLADAEAAHRALVPVLDSASQRERWFRPPLLHMGYNARRRIALDAWMFKRGYRLGVVTIDNQEWVFAAAYERMLKDGDAARAEAVADAYVAHIMESVAYHRALARRLFEREIPHVILLHANRLNADHLADVLDALKAGGAKFVRLETAAADPAYRSPDRYKGPRGLSWLLRWAEAKGVRAAPEPREPEWIAEAARRPPSP